MFKFNLVVGLSISLLGCNINNREVSKTKADNLIGGEIDEKLEYNSTLVYGFAGDSMVDGFCTGAKVAPNLILTAAHCVLTQKESGSKVYSGPWVDDGSFAAGEKN